MKTSFCLPLLVLSFISLSSCEAYSQKGVDAYGGAYSQKGVDADMDGDYKTAMKWYTLAAEQGYVEAQYALAIHYENGQGMPQDDKTAVKWYTLAAEQGHAASQYNLGVCYANGQYGVPQDPVYAHMWWNIAASSGHDDAKKPRYYCKKYVCVSNRRSTETCS